MSSQSRQNIAQSPRPSAPTAVPSSPSPASAANRRLSLKSKVRAVQVASSMGRTSMGMAGSSDSASTPSTPRRERFATLPAAFDFSSAAAVSAASSLPNSQSLNRSSSRQSLEPPTQPSPQISPGRRMSTQLNRTLSTEAMKSVTSPPQSTRSSFPLPSPAAANDMESVRVIVRCRPFIKDEAGKAKRVVEVVEPQLVNLSVKGQVKPFTYDRVYGENSTQSEVFEESCKSVIDKALNGFNATIFAYGQTGSGKSHTITGVLNDSELQGVIPRAIDQIFAEISSSTSVNGNTENNSTDTQPPESGVEWLTIVSFLELYNEKIFDLLGQGSKVALDIRETSESGFYVPNLSKHVVTNREEILSLIHKGNSNRFVAATSQNEVSSRSHSMLIVYMEKNSVNAADNSSALLTASKLNIVDLAGSERMTASAQERQGKETMHINLSLSTLASVITALTEGAAHIPYRDSKLTKLLRESLGGNSVSLLVACINGADYNAQETLSTLRYASRAKKIKNKPKINEDPKDAILRGLHEEIFALKHLIAQKNTIQLQMFHLARELSQPDAINRRIQFLMKCLAGSKESAAGDRTIEDRLILGSDPLPLNFETSEEILKTPTAHPLVDQVLASAPRLLPSESAPVGQRLSDEKEESKSNAGSEPSTPRPGGSDEPKFDASLHSTTSHFLYQLYLKEIGKIYRSLSGGPGMRAIESEWPSEEKQNETESDSAAKKRESGAGPAANNDENGNGQSKDNNADESSENAESASQALSTLCEGVNQVIEEERGKLAQLIADSAEEGNQLDPDSSLALLAQMPSLTPSDAAAQFESLTTLCFRLASELAEAKKSSASLKSENQKLNERFSDAVTSKLELIKNSNQELERMKHEIDDIEVEIATVRRNSVSVSGSAPGTPKPTPGKRGYQQQNEEEANEKGSCTVQ